MLFLIHVVCSDGTRTRCVVIINIRRSIRLVIAATWRVWSWEGTFKSAIFPSSMSWSRCWVDVFCVFCRRSSDHLDSFRCSASFCCFNRSFMSSPVCRFISTCGSRSESSDLASARPALPVHGDPQLGRSVSQRAVCVAVRSRLSACVWCYILSCFRFVFSGLSLGGKGYWLSKFGFNAQKNRIILWICALKTPQTSLPAMKTRCTCKMKHHHRLFSPLFPVAARHVVCNTRIVLI